MYFEKNNFQSSEIHFFSFKLALNMFKDLHKTIKFFRNKDDVFFAYFATNLKPLYVKPGEFVYNKGEYPHSGYLIKLKFLIFI